MSTRETVDILSETRAFMAGDAFANRLGITLEELDAERCVCRMPLTPDHRNAVGVAHGGAVFSLADFAGACLANAQGRKTLAINGYVVYMAATDDGPLTATARRIRAGKTLVHSEVKVVDARDRLLATLTTTGFKVE